MFTLKRLIGGSLFVLVLAGTALAQENRAPIDTPREPVAPIPAAPLVTAAATAERVRFVSPGTVVQLRLEVYNETGQKLFDTELHGGNVLDWHLQDGAGERLAAGSYACVLTIKSLSGRLSQRVGLVTVNEKRAAIETAGAAQLSTAQQQAIGPVFGPVEGNAFTVVQESEAEAITTVTHDGTEGQVARTRGALSFRLGDFFSGKDKEQMRLTEEGNLGIGTDKPQAKLDVAGVIRTSKGIEFENGMNVTKLTTTASGSLQQTLADGTVVPNASGSGTQNQVAKWTDNAGALGDSTITELNGKVGIGTTNPGGQLHIFGTATDDVFAGMGPDVLLGPAFNYGYAGFSFGRGAGFFNVRPDAGATPPNPSLRFMTANVERMIVTNTGNVGIGNTAPGAKLDVTGNINTSTQYNIGGSRVLSVPGSQNVFAGVGAGQSNTTGFGNSFFGRTAGFSNTSASDNSFFGSEAGRNNTTGFNNSFFGLSAGFGNTTGGSNSFFGHGAGALNTTGFSNSFFGTAAGFNNTTGNSNIFIGDSSGFSNSVESNNTFIGNLTNGAAGITNATAIGFQAKVTQSNSLVLGSINEVNFATADTNVGIGTTAPTYKLHVNDASNTGLRVLTNTAGGTVASFGGLGAFVIDTVSTVGGRFTVQESGNVGIGTTAPAFKLHVNDASNTGLRVQTNAVGGTVASFAANGDFQIDAQNIGGGRFIVKEGGNVGIGVNNPTHKLEVNGSVAGVGPYENISDVRFKKNIYPLSGALNKVLHLRGVSFDWRSDEFPALNFSQGRQVGFIAQEMAGVLPEAVTRDDKGYYRMAYSEVTPVLVEAIKEQQQEIQEQQVTVKQQQAQIEEQQQQLQQKHLRIEKLEARLAALETVVKNISVRQRPRRKR